MDEFDDLVFDDYNFETDLTPAPPVNDSSEVALTNTQFGNTELTQENVQKIKVLRLDEQLLLEPKGIPLLRVETRHLKFQGKNHEAEDLRRLMSYYSVWADQLYPKLKFSQFSKKVGKAASGKGVRDLIAGWQDEFNEKMQAKRDQYNQLSGQTVGDEEHSEEDSSDDDNRPLFIPMSASLTDTLQVKKTPKSKTNRVNKKKHRSSDTIHSEDDEEDSIITKKPRTVTFSDDEELTDTPTSAKSGREYALSVLAEKRKQKQLAQEKLRQQEEKLRQQKEKLRQQKEKLAAEKLEKTKSVDEIIKEYYDDDVQLALSDSELLALEIPTEHTTHNQVTKKPNEDEIDFDNIEMEDIGDL